MKPTVVVICFLLAGCAPSPSLPTNQELALGLQLSPLQSAAVDQVRQACPGLAEYFPDTRITEVLIPGIADDVESTVIFEVADRSRDELSSMMAEGHRCYLDTSNGITSTSKRPCLSVCRKREYMGENSPPYQL